MYDSNPNSDLEDFDQLSSSRAASSSSSRNVKATESFVMPKSLKRPRDVQYSVRSLYDDIKRGLIDVNPEYQRDIVWKTEKQMMLIDSVFTGHYMPPIIFSVIYDDEGSEARKVCLDGKQRLTSLRLFLDGEIPLKHPDTLKNWWFKADSSPSAKSRNVIPERVRTSFVNRQIHCTEYEDLDDEDEREIFRRVQMGMALSTAEKLQVTNSRRARFINELKTLYVTEESLGAHSFRWERSRGADYRCLSQAVYVMFRWGDNNGSAVKNAGTLPQVEKWLYDDSEPLPDSFVASVKETFSTLVKLTLDPKYSTPFSMYAKVSPIEIIGVSVLIYAHSVIAQPSKKLTFAELSAAFASLRQDVRREHKDIRLNDRVGKTVINFVKAYQKPVPSPHVEATATQNPASTALPPIVPRSQAMAIDPSSSSSSSHISHPPFKVSPVSPHSTLPSFLKRKSEYSHTQEPSPKRYAAQIPTNTMTHSASGYPYVTAPHVTTPSQSQPARFLYAGQRIIEPPATYPSPPTNPSPPLSTNSESSGSSSSSRNAQRMETRRPTLPPISVKTEPSDFEVGLEQQRLGQHLERVPVAVPTPQNLASQWQRYYFIAERPTGK